MNNHRFLVVLSALAFAAHLSAQVTVTGSLTLPTSSATQLSPSLMTPADRKTFAAKQNALGYTPENPLNKNALGGYLGLDLNGKAPYSRLTGVPIASSLIDGILTHANWATFNAKQSAIGFIPENPLNKNKPNGYLGADPNGMLQWTQISNVPTASATTFGCLKPGDWVLFNNKQNALGFIPENPLNKNKPIGYAGLDAMGLIPRSLLPPLPPVPVQVFNESYQVSADTANGIFTLLSSNVVAASVSGYRNGLRLTPNVDFSVSGSVVTLASTITLSAGDVVLFDYQHN